MNTTVDRLNRDGSRTVFKALQNPGSHIITLSEENTTNSISIPESYLMDLLKDMERDHNVVWVLCECGEIVKVKTDVKSIPLRTRPLAGTKICRKCGRPISVDYRISRS